MANGTSGTRRDNVRNVPNPVGPESGTDRDTTLKGCPVVPPVLTGASTTTKKEGTSDMTTNKITTDEYFGGCPECGHTDGFLNCERTHWFICDLHRTKWCAGANLFSCWRNEDEAIWTKNAIRIWHYRNVEPIYPELAA